MNLEHELLKEHSRRQADRLASWVGTDRTRVQQLMALFLRGENRVTQRAAWVVGICAERHPALMRPYLRKMINRMNDPGVHDAVKRNVVRLLQTIDIPPSLVGLVASRCFEFLSSVQTPVAIRAFSMTVLTRIARERPDLARELRLVIEQHLPYGSAGFRARAREVLQSLGESSPRVPTDRGRAAGGVPRIVRPAHVCETFPETEEKQ